ncbi:H(+)-transporting V1 sector ATPase subunit H SCDLUD_000114 [Saccharomycodes ludwigii]|uniref:H(+)-transporting V1 sector ATPase subunit H n=1 Tax=Saccharomycodes ludwigii TaxID=36035 RepID=UPI001E87DF5F|nr:hypothetical protein SCDLUD_000114 [Saccharomycodes ludwigii]KAH3902535.1 hypothetical protein SCDLUD_000114 [Saccharomycodes ludwigii]
MTVDKQQHFNKILVDSTHFANLRRSIKFRSILWDNYARSKELSELDASIAKKLEKELFDNKNNWEDQQAKIDFKKVIPVLVHILETSTTKPDIIKVVGNLLVELLIRYDETFIFFNENVQYYSKLSTLITKGKISIISANSDDDEVLELIFLYILVSLTVNSNEYENKKNIVDQILSQFLTPDLKNANPSSTKKITIEREYVVIRFLQELSAIKCFRPIVWKYNSQFVQPLFNIILGTLLSESTDDDINNASPLSNSISNILSSRTGTNLPANNINVQLQYYALLTLWLLTFNKTIAKELSSNYTLQFIKLLKLVTITVKEKISRLSIAILLNCCKVPHNTEVVKKLVLLGNALQNLQSLKERKYSDLELNEDLDELKTIVDQSLQELNSFDEYLAELDSKMLCWSPPHVDNQFWNDNIDKFKDDHWKIFKNLIAIVLSTGTDNTTDLKDKSTKLQVALSDITHVIELLPESIVVLDKEGAKLPIMELLNYPDSKVKYEALKTVQALIKVSFK